MHWRQIFFPHTEPLGKSPSIHILTLKGLYTDKIKGPHLSSRNLQSDGEGRRKEFQEVTKQNKTKNMYLNNSQDNVP